MDPLSKLNTFCQKTDYRLDEVEAELERGGWHVTLKLLYNNRPIYMEGGDHISKKEAKRIAARKLYKQNQVEIDEVVFGKPKTTLKDDMRAMCIYVRNLEARILALEQELRQRYQLPLSCSRTQF